MFRRQSLLLICRLKAAKSETLLRRWVVDREGLLNVVYEMYVGDVTNLVRNDWKDPVAYATDIYSVGHEGPGKPSDAQAMECILQIGNGIHHSL